MIIYGPKAEVAAPVLPEVSEEPSLQTRRLAAVDSIAELRVLITANMPDTTDTALNSKDKEQ